jgi:uncharacterized protein
VACVRVFNDSRGVELARDARVADDFSSRFVGLMGSSSLPRGSGLVIAPCNSIHTCFMRYAIDAIFVDANETVVGIARELRPWRFSRLVWKARKVVELPAGTVAATGTAEGDRLAFEGAPRSSGEASTRSTGV